MKIYGNITDEKLQHDIQQCIQQYNELNEGIRQNGCYIYEF